MRATEYRRIPLVIFLAKRLAVLILSNYLVSHIIRIVIGFLFCPVWKETFSSPVDLLRPPSTVSQAEPPFHWLTAELGAKFDSWS